MNSPLNSTSTPDAASLPGPLPDWSRAIDHLCNARAALVLIDALADQAANSPAILEESSSASIADCEQLAVLVLEIARIAREAAPAASAYIAYGEPVSQVEGANNG